MIDPCEDCLVKPGIYKVYGDAIICDTCIDDYAPCKECDVLVGEGSWHVLGDGDNAIYLCDEPNCYGQYMQQCDYCEDFWPNELGNLSPDGTTWACTECQITYWADDEDEDEDED